MTGPDWGWMAALCVTGALGHWTLIKCYELAEANAVQPFAYLQLVMMDAVKQHEHKIKGSTLKSPARWHPQG